MPTEPDLSIIIPARNEERLIPGAIESVRIASNFFEGSIEIVVVLNRCTDRTEEIARAAGCVIVRNDEKNLSKIRNEGARASKGKIIVTMDADSRMSSNMLLKISSTLSSKRYVGGGVLIIPERWSLGILLTGFLLLPLILFHRISGGLFFCYREDFFAINGFDESRVSAEDIDFAKRLRGFGAKTRRRYATLLRAYIVTSCRKFDTFGDWYFLKNPKMVIRLLQGRDQRYADKIWYDYEA